jgi:hypothetical protein
MVMSTVGKMHSVPTAQPHSDRSQPVRVSRNLRRAGRLLAWSALMAIAILVALVLQNLAASAVLVAQGPAELPAACRAALAAGDHVRESFVAHSCAGVFDTISKP